jgi:hypothetical protein
MCKGLLCPLVHEGEGCFLKNSDKEAFLEIGAEDEKSSDPCFTPMAFPSIMGLKIYGATEIEFTEDRYG